MQQADNKTKFFYENMNNMVIKNKNKYFVDTDFIKKMDDHKNYKLKLPKFLSKTDDDKTIEALLEKIE